MPPKNQPRYRKCYVSGCTTYTVKGLYIIPEHPVKRQPWIDACQFPANIPNGAKVCWKHFQKSDFKGDIDESECHFPRIHTGAVPSLLLPGSENEQEPEPEPVLPDLPDPVIESSASNNPISVVYKYLRVQSVILLKNIT